MNTDPLLQRTYDNGFADAIEAINMLIEQLTAAWGSVAISCEKQGCVVGDGVDQYYTGLTLLDALRKAAEEEAQP